MLAEQRADASEFGVGGDPECDGACGTKQQLEGRALYAHGGALDHPLVVLRPDGYNDQIVPVYNWRGRPVDGICV